MDVVRVHFCLNNFYLLPLTQLSQYFSYFFPLLSVKYFSPIFWGKYYVIFAIPTRMLLSLMKMLLREIDAREDGCEMVCQDLTEVLLVKIVRMASVSLRLTAPPSESKECAAAKRYIDENYSESITLDKLAEIAHVNKYYLSHSFKNEYKVSPIDYLMKRRITEAKALLTSTDFSLTQIAEQIGFGSLPYFSKCFRKVEGTSPNEYRKSAKQKPAQGTR